MHDNTLTQDNRDKFIQLAKTYKQTIKFYNLEEICLNKIREFEKSIPQVVKRYSIGSTYRFFIPNALPSDIKKIIYLDSDVVVNLNINELWKIKFTEAIAAIPEVDNYVNTMIHASCREKLIEAEHYFNSGVIVINVEKFRGKNDLIIRGMKIMTDNPQYDCFDQDILNYCFSKNYLKLPKKFNTLVEYARIHNDFETDDRICHYITSSRGGGFGLDTNDAFNKLFLKYFIKTPWFSEDSIGRLYEQVVNLYNGRQNFATQVSALMSGKQRAFFVTPPNIDATKNIFYVNPNEEIIPAENLASLEKVFVSLKDGGGKKIFFLLMDQYPAIRELFMKAGFVEGRDFINGMAFLSNAHGVKMNPYPLVKAM
ncbi:MAG: hypothetical protein IJS81_11755 [Selenomonadaceae bacterium]|nr:hypothetical protein [Selenomonadaceae bacterium]